MSTYSYGPRQSRPNRSRKRMFASQNRNRKTNKGVYINPERFIKKADPAVPVEDYQPQHSFEDFALLPAIQANVRRRDYKTPTAIQDQAIKPILEGNDLIGIANTGTGKTAAFILPLLDKILRNPSEQAIILAPTRELALQIDAELKLFAGGLRIYSTLCIGGTNIDRQISSLRRNPHFIIGTPGRIKDLLKRNSIKLANFHNVVLDEVDRMVDIGFIRDIELILKQMPTERQSLFFSATTTPKINALMSTFLKNPVTVSVRTGETTNNVDQDIVRAAPGLQKIEVLHEIINGHEVEKVIIFVDTKRNVEKLSRDLNARGLASITIHSNKSQSQRQRALKQFKAGESDILVATDVAARGLDIDGVTHVINYELPQSYDDYVHRIGRTGRAGKVGKALTFV